MNMVGSNLLALNPTTTAALIAGGVVIVGFFIKYVLDRQPPPTPADKAIISFFVQCFNRPAFKTSFAKEDKEEDYVKAVEDTLTAINTGKLFRRDSTTILKESGSRHELRNAGWRKNMEKVAQDLQNIKQTYTASVKSGKTRVFKYPSDEDAKKNNTESAYFMPDKDPEAIETIDELRDHAIETLVSICREARVASEGLGPLPKKKKNKQ